MQDRVINEIIAGAGTMTPDRRDAIMRAAQRAFAEVVRAREKWPAFHSAHEGYAVALEEVDELWEHVKVKQGKRDLDAMRYEAIQCAAMFIAFAAECCDDDPGESTG